jgi:uridine kinase
MNYFEIHQKKYPNRQIQDDMKWLFQSVMGCEHFVLDEKKSLERIKDECFGDNHYFIEDVNDLFVRFHFENLKDGEMVALNQLFIASSKVKSGTKENLKDALLKLKETKNKEEQLFIDEYIASGMPPISHSDYFKSFYKPHYRVIYKHYLPFFDLVMKINEKGFKVLTIDGRCGSGKSTLGKLLSEVYQCPLIHMDDFYLPKELRTEDRYNEPGGNVHYERFEDEVYLNILKGVDFKYGVFSHEVMGVHHYQEVKASERYVIEGSYSFHPKLRKYSDFKVFLTQNKESQKKRIIKRNGEEIWKMFESKWIPLEELYFSSEDLESIANVVIDVSEG